MHRPTIFSSFWMAGFESACHVNRKGARLDMIAATQHDRFVDGDYARLRQMGMSSVRDTARWHLIERSPGVYDFSSMDPMLAAARCHRIQVIWDLCHYGWPDGLDLFSTSFVDRFARFCTAVATHVREQSDDVPSYTPINEVSFFAWASGDAGWFFPHGANQGGEIKRQLIRACVAGIEAIWAVDARARIVTVEPLIHVVPAAGRKDARGAADYRNSQFEAWDMLSGAMAPELGGDSRYLDVMGVNFYHDNQWEHPAGKRIVWHIRPRDARWLPFHRLIKEAYDRYRRPIFVGETSHVGSGRAEWLREMADELCLAIDAGVPVEGVCLYPIIDRFEWDNPSHWHNSGLWDLEKNRNGELIRVLDQGYAAELWNSQLKLAHKGYGSYPPFAIETADSRVV
ncbi:MAG: beta-glucosidase [Acidobacteria bacterium]|nr:beta-glucosidase [Acidobacteriota bacterium]